MNKNDLIRQNEKNWPYYVMANIWGKEVKVLISIRFSFSEDQLDDLVSIVEKKIAFLNNSRAAIEQTLLDEDAVSMANDWAESAEPDEEEEDVYIMEDGTKVRLPITKEYFLSTISIVETSIEFWDSLDDASTTAYVECEPDFFAGHAYEICINKEDQIYRCAFCG